MRAYPVLTIILDADSEVRARVIPSLHVAPIGCVTFPLEQGEVTIQSCSPSELYAVASGFVTAAGKLRRLIEDSAPVTTPPGADALDGATSGVAQGERSGEPAITGAADRVGDPVAAPPSNVEVPTQFLEHGSKFDRSLSEMDAGL